MQKEIIKKPNWLDANQLPLLTKRGRGFETWGTVLQTQVVVIARGRGGGKEEERGAGGREQLRYK